MGDKPPEEFCREKLAESVRRACGAVGRDDLTAPARIIPLALEKLMEKPRMGEGEMTTTAIKDAV